MPTPHPDEETQSEWMSRCVPQVMDDGTAQDSDQAVAMCMDMWRHATEGKSVIMNRAYSLLTVKAVDEDKRIMTGTATTPSVDRMGDIIEPLGVKFKNPLPLLLFHHHDAPVGTVRFSKPTADGIEFEAKLPTIGAAGTLKDRVDEAWQSVKAGLIRAVSIGFRALDPFEETVERIKGGGLRFLKTEVLELSLVVVPANQDATIANVRSIDTALLAASGRKDSSGSPNRPGVPGSRNSDARPKEANHNMKTIQDQIRDLETQRDSLAEQMKGFGDVTNLDETKQPEFDAVSADFEKAEKNLGRLQSMARAMGDASAAKGLSQDEGSKSRQGKYDALSAARDNTPKLEKGIRFARYALAMMAGRGSVSDALEYAKRWHNQTPEVSQYIRAVAGAATLASPGWGSELAFQNNLASEFVELLRAETVIGRIQGFRRVPFNVRIPTQTGGSTVNWVGESAPKPVGELEFSETTIGYTKIAGIVVFSEELARLSDPSAETLVRDDLVAEVTKFKDEQFLDPTISPTANRPGSITYNLTTSINATGHVDAADMKADIADALRPMRAANIRGPIVFIMDSDLALGISLLENGIGNPSFPNMTPNGGTLLGYPVIVSNSTVAGTITILAPNEIFLAEDPSVRVDASREATLDMSGSTTASYSLWQRNNIGVRAEQWVNYKRRRDLAVAMITNATYGPVETS